MITGILFGLLAAVFQSLSYVCSRLFVKQHHNNTVSLLALSHILMGAFSVPLAIYLLPGDMPPLSIYWKSLLVTAGFYLLGQLFLFAAIVRSEPSRVSPLLGIKVLFLAVISVVFYQDHFSVIKWLAVLCSAVSVLLLSQSGKKLDWKSIVFAMLACTAYCLSDLGIKALVDHFQMLDIVHRASLSTALCYILCGIVGGIILWLMPYKVSRDTWLYAAPFAVSWFTAMIFLFSCFGLVGVVFGNVLQSSRGILSIVMGFLIAQAGHVALEPKITRMVLIQRILAAILMTASVALFAIEP